MVNQPFLKQTVASARFGREVLRHHADLHRHLRSTLVTDDVEVRMNGVESPVFNGGYRSARLAMPVQVSPRDIEIKPARETVHLCRRQWRLNSLTLRSRAQDTDSMTTNWRVDMRQIIKLTSF